MRTRVLGLAAALVIGTALPSFAANVVSNPGFETGDFTSWTQFGDTFFDSVGSGAEHTGTFGASFGAVDSVSGIFQDVTVDANSTYNVDFWLRNLGDVNLGEGEASSFEVLFDGVSLTSLSNSAAFGYQFFHFTAATDNDNTARLEFRFRHDPSFWNLDDVCADNARNGACSTPTDVPEPAGMALFGFAVAGLAALRRRRAA
jgi:hypothetical protein